jgi:hypothetical protein
MGRATRGRKRAYLIQVRLGHDLANDRVSRDAEHVSGEQIHTSSRIKPLQSHASQTYHAAVLYINAVDAELLEPTRGSGERSRRYASRRQHLRGSGSRDCDLRRCESAMRPVVVLDGPNVAFEAGRALGLAESWARG